MNSLFDLNNFGQTSVTITDARFATVLFDRMTPLQPLDQEQTITSQTVSIEPGIEILDIINYSTANVRYIVEIKSNNVYPLTGSTLTWPTLPAHLTLSNVGDVYTITGFRTASDWTAARAFTWNLPAEYTIKPKWWLESKIVYFEEELDEDVIKDWASYDLKYYEVAALSATASVDVVYKRRRIFEADLTSSFSMLTDEGLEKQGRASINAEFALNASALDVGLSATFTQTANNSRLRNFEFAKSAAFTQITNNSVFKAINNMGNRSYTSNARNIIFNSFGQPAPYIEEAPGDSGTYQVELTSTSGEWSTTADDYTGSSSLSFTGTKDEVNAWFLTVTWYPTKNFTSNVAVTYTQYKDGSLQITKNFAFEHAANGTITPTTTIYNTSSNALLGDYATYTWTPTLAQKKYAVMDYLIVGSGEAGQGGSFGSGRGGRAGQFIEVSGATISNTSYTIAVGASTDGSGSGDSFFNGQTAVRGYSGGYGNGTDANNGSVIAYGGGSGSSSAGAGGIISGSSPFTATGGNGGQGTLSSIDGTSRYYASGGGGGFSVGSSDTGIRGKNGENGTTFYYGYGGQGRSYKSPSTYGGDSPGRSGVVIIKVRG